MKPSVYIISNVIYQIVICWVLLILNAFYNELLISENLAHSSAKVVLRILIAVAEGGVLLLMVYGINISVLSDNNGKESKKGTASRTAIVQLIITVVFVIAENLR